MNKKDCLDLLFHSYSAITTVRALALFDDDDDDDVC
jgi:hypothetical protein